MSFDNLSSLMSTSTSFSSDLNLNSELNPARGRSSTNTTGSSQAQGNQISIAASKSFITPHISRISKESFSKFI